MVLQCVSTTLLVLLKEQEHVVLELIAISDTGKCCNSTENEVLGNKTNALQLSRLCPPIAVSRSLACS